MTMKLVSSYWAHQDDYIQNHALDPEHIMLWEPRTGKTRAACEGFMRAINEGGVFRVLITGPREACREVWVKDEIPRALAKLEEALPYKIVSLIDIPLVDRKLLLHQLIVDRKERIRTGHAPQVEVVVVNRDALDPLKKLLLEWNPQFFVVDELHKFKHSGALRSRTAYAIGEQAKYRLGLTGTPASRDLRDIYGQWKVIAPRIFGTNKAAFEERYCVFPPSKWQTKPVAYRNVEELQQKAFSIASIVFRKDCWDIPQTQDVIREVSLPASARDIYNNIVQQHILELEDVKTPMTHTLSRMMQLRQIAIGYARYDTDGGLREAKWLHTGKIDMAAEDIDNIVCQGKKVIVFHSFHLEAMALHNKLRTMGIESDLVNGKVLGAVRSGVISAFQESDLPVIIIQEDTASEGISLTAADYTLFLSHGASADTHKQASDRSFKPQDETNSIKLVRTYIRVRGTVEVSMFNMVQQKLSLEEQLLRGGRQEAFKRVAEGLV